MPQDHQFIDLDHFTSLQDNTGIELIVRQNPDRAQVSTVKDKLGDKPVDPPPIVQIKQSSVSPQAFNHVLQNPSFFMMTEVIGPTDVQQVIPSDAFSGTLSSSLHKLKDVDNNGKLLLTYMFAFKAIVIDNQPLDGGFFIFPEISVRLEGSFRLRFKLYQLYQGKTHFITSLCSEVFTVYSPKAFPGIQESTFLSRSFSDQGARIRVRKGSRTSSKRKGSTLTISSYPGSSNFERRNSLLSTIESTSPNKKTRSPSLETTSDSEGHIPMERRASYLIASHLGIDNLLNTSKNSTHLSPRPFPMVFNNTTTTTTSFTKPDRESNKATPESTSYSECSTGSINSSFNHSRYPYQGIDSQTTTQITVTSLPPIDQNPPIHSGELNLQYNTKKSDLQSPSTTTTDLFPNMFSAYLNQLNIPLSSDNGRTRCQRR
ncbi:hypothetical protein K7432_004979 [Basidiobolus ranarum]|uniref:Velvet domain-containing protein n=1 Tax=Basidiobolus ranarum TaxID=34480 RepID=A0ABR2W3T0_9FUNG